MSTRKQYSPHCYMIAPCVVFSQTLQRSHTTDESLSLHLLLCVCLNLLSLKTITRVTGFSPLLLVIAFLYIYLTRLHRFVVNAKYKDLPHTYSVCLCEREPENNHSIFQYPELNKSSNTKNNLHSVIIS